MDSPPVGDFQAGSTGSAVLQHGEFIDIPDAAMPADVPAALSGTVILAILAIKPSVLRGLLGIRHFFSYHTSP
jgi:hypothetical protein